MKTKLMMLVAVLVVCWTGTLLAGDETSPLTPALSPNGGGGVGLYADTFLSLRTPDFKDSTYGYGIGVGYQVTRHWGADLRLSHQGLDAEGSAVQDIGGRLIARMPWETLQPYTFIGGSFDLERDAWHIDPGVGVAIGKRLQWFAEAGIDADLRGHSGYKFGSGLRLRF